MTKPDCVRSVMTDRLAAAAGMLAVLLLAGCGGGDPAATGETGLRSPSAGPSTGPTHTTRLNAEDVCPGGAFKGAVVECTQLRPGGPSLPADSPTVTYGSLARGGERFLTRRGALALAPSMRTALQSQLAANRAAAASAQGGAVDDGDVAARTGPYAQLVYRAQVHGTTVDSLVPVVRIDESALMTSVFGGKVLEGTIARLDSPETGYGLDATLPVRVELAATAVNGVVTGRIVNATRSVRTATGTCAPALIGQGAHNPLANPFTDTVELQRYPSMHVPFDDEMLLKWDSDASNMGVDFYPSAATALGLDPLGKSWVTTLHGNPTAGPALTLRVVQGGGGTC